MEQEKIFVDTICSGLSAIKEKAKEFNSEKTKAIAYMIEKLVSAINLLYEEKSECDCMFCKYPKMVEELEKNKQRTLN